MPEEIRRNVIIETNIDAYRNLFNDDWGQRIDALTVESPQLAPLVFDLMLGWRSAAYTASLPVSIIEHMRAFHDGFVNTGEINTPLLRLAIEIPARLAQEIPALANDPQLIRRLQEKVVMIGANLEEARNQAKVEFPTEETWNRTSRTTSIC